MPAATRPPRGNFGTARSGPWLPDGRSRRGARETIPGSRTPCVSSTTTNLSASLTGSRRGLCLPPIERAWSGRRWARVVSNHRPLACEARADQPEAEEEVQQLSGFRVGGWIAAVKAFAGVLWALGHWRGLVAQ